jgi:acetyl-CoA carboxylase biotin carboxylase subunit
MLNGGPTVMDKVLIANRGAVARRVVRACNELGLKSVVVFSEADSDAPYLSEASEAYPLIGTAAAATYLDQTQILSVLQQTGADALHPGYGFLAENAEFARAVAQHGGQFIGPDEKWLSLMGDKVSARQIMAEQGFPIFPGSELLQDPEVAIAQAREIGYPVLVKPSGGGGGLGMERVANEEELLNAVGRSRAIASRAFAASGVYLERCIENPRHIEFQIMASEQGEAVHVYERECSVQRRNQKLIEESPAPSVDAVLMREQAELAALVCNRLGYNNLGTIEALLTPTGELGFLEMNTRLQVEHGVTEEVTGLDLVQTQIKLSAGEALPQVPASVGHAIEARIYAENAETLLPSTGRLSVYRPPRMFGVRIESGYQEGQLVTPYYDAMLAKVIARADTRELAIGRLANALKGFEIRGVDTNQPLLLKILGDAEFIAGNVDTGIVDRLLNRK